MITPRLILAATISCSALAAACVDDISSTSGDTLSAAEFASMSDARDELMIASFGMGFGSRGVPMQSLVASSVESPHPYVRTTPCPAGGVTTMTYFTIFSGDRSTSTVTEKVTDCGVAWVDGMTWTFASRRLDWTMTGEYVGFDFRHDARVTGALSWAGAGKRGGCLVDLQVRETGTYPVSDTLTMRGQACGALVDLVVGYR